MAVVVESSGSGIISLEELVDYCECELDSTSHDSLIAAEPYLSALARNRTFLADTIARELKDYKSIEERSGYVVPVIVLHRETTSNFFVRANIWPAGDDYIVESSGPDVFSYGRPHDHNFNFLTVGYHGPGYWSDHYECDNDKVSGYPGERVESLEFIESSTLEQGKVMLYRAHQDVHVQKPADEFSISLNIMEQSLRPLVTDQYGFDVVNKRIANFNNKNPTTSVISVAASIGDDNSIDLIEHISTHHPNPRVRLAAHKALATTFSDLENKLEVLEAGQLDPSDLVRKSCYQYQQELCDSYGLISTKNG